MIAAQHIDYAALLDDAAEAINAEACRLVADPERVTSFLRLIEWTREETIAVALAANQADVAGELIIGRLNELAQECAEEEWMQ